MNILKIVAAGVLLVGSFAFAEQSKMDGVSVVCDKDSNFMAFNLTAKKIWMGKGVFKNGELAEHMNNVEMTPQVVRRAVLAYKGDSVMDFGGQKIELKYAGVLYMDKTPMETTVSVTVAGQTKTITVFCKAN